MTRDDVAELLRKACAEVLVVDEGDITGRMGLTEELDVDSLDVTEIIEILKDHGISMPVDEVMRIRTFDELTDFAHGCVTAGSSQ